MGDGWRRQDRSGNTPPAGPTGWSGPTGGSDPPFRMGWGRGAGALSSEASGASAETPASSTSLVPTPPLSQDKRTLDTVSRKRLLHRLDLPGKNLLLCKAQLMLCPLQEGFPQCPTGPVETLLLPDAPTTPCSLLH